MQSSVPIHIGGSGLDYELIDTGDFEKLERFGQYTLRRPEPQAIWAKSLTELEWNKLSNASYARLKASHYRDAEETGSWSLGAKVKEPWYIDFKNNDVTIKFKLGFTAFKHVGIFPEQSCNWNWIMEELSQKPQAKVLNLFAYTGGASLAAKAVGADVTHLDAVKGMISWARENMELSALNNIRWIIEDAVKFVEREVRRKNTYDLIIMDPPAYGRGPSGEKWVLDQMLRPLIDQAKQLLTSDGKILLNLYSLNHSALLIQNLGGQASHWGESVLQDRAGRLLPLGVFGVLK